MAEDTAYKVDQSMAAFKRITSQNKVNLYYADSTGFAKSVNPELERNGNILMTGASFGKELSDAQKYGLQFMVGPDYSEMVGILLQYIAKTKPGAKVALVYSDTEFGRDPVEAARASIKQLGLSVATEIVTAPGSVDVSAEVVKLRYFVGMTVADIAALRNVSTRTVDRDWVKAKSLLEEMVEQAP